MQWRLGVALVMFTAALGAVLMVRPVVELPVDLEPAPGTAQCNYELLGAFSKYMRSRGKGLRYTLAAGTLLGAMRNEPPGLLQWEHDVDVYMPARDASHLLRRLQRDCAATAWYHWRSAAANLAASLTPISSRSHPDSSRPHDSPQIPIAFHRISILLSQFSIPLITNRITESPSYSLPILDSLMADSSLFSRSSACVILHPRGLVDSDGGACCGFGFKLFHRTVP